METKTEKVVVTAVGRVRKSDDSQDARGIGRNVSRKRDLNDDSHKVYTDEFGRELTREEWLAISKAAKSHGSKINQIETEAFSAVAPESSKSSGLNKQVVSMKADVAATMEGLVSVEDILGFSDFSSTKGKKVSGNQEGASRGAVAKVPKREYRQYLNRPGGYNRPLDPVKDSKGSLQKKKQ